MGAEEDMETTEALVGLGVVVGVVVGVGITFAALIKAAWDQAKKANP